MGQVVDIAQPADRCVTGIILEGSWVGEAHTRALMGELRRHGAFATEAASPALLVVTWGEGMTPVQVEEAVEQAAGAARDDDVLVSLAFCIPPTDRTREVLQAEVDFTLCTKPRVPETTTTYWAADEPYWATNGLAEPGFRAYVQNLAGQHRPEPGDAAAAGGAAVLRGMRAWGAQSPTVTRVPPRAPAAVAPFDDPRVRVASGNYDSPASST